MYYQIIPKRDYQFNLENTIMLFKNIGSEIGRAHV